MSFSTTTGLITMGLVGTGLIIYQVLKQRKSHGDTDDLNSDASRYRLTNSAPHPNSAHHDVSDQVVAIKQNTLFLQPPSQFQSDSSLLTGRPRPAKESPSTTIGVPRPKIPVMRADNWDMAKQFRAWQ